MPFIDVQAWLESAPLGGLPWEQVAAVVVLLAAIACLLRRRREAPCSRCRQGDRLEGLEYVGIDGQTLGVRCQDCRGYFARDLANARVTAVNRAYARAHWLNLL